MTDPARRSSRQPVDVSSLQELLAALFAALAADDISYVVLHGYEGLPNRVENDVDLLVDSSNVARFRRHILEVANRTGWKLIKNPVRFGFQSFWLKSSVAKDLVQIDAWSTIHWKSVPWIDGKAMLYARRRFGALYIPCAADEAAYLLVKDVIATGRIKQKYLPAIARTVKEEPKEVESALKWGFGEKAAAWLVRRVERNDWQGIENECAMLRFALLKRNVLRTPFRLPSNACWFLWGHLTSRVARSNGFFLALIGPDGSGKTTISVALDKCLGPVFRKRSFYHGRFGFLPDLRVFLNIAWRSCGRKVLPPAPSGPSAVHDVPPHSTVRCSVHALYYGLDYFLGHLTVCRFQAIGDLVVFDRYFYDWFIHASYKNTPSWLLPVLRTILPRPDLVVFLSNSPEVIHQRKPELTIKQIARQNRKCLEINRHMTYAASVSTTQPPEEVAREIADRIVTIMADRFQEERP